MISKTIQTIGMSLFILVVASVSANASDLDKIQIKSNESKPINWIVPNRNLTAIEYRVQFDGFYVECVSITMHSDDGTKLSHAYNRCVEHLARNQ